MVKLSHILTISFALLTVFQVVQLAGITFLSLSVYNVNFLGNSLIYLPILIYALCKSFTEGNIYIQIIALYYVCLTIVNITCVCIGLTLNVSYIPFICLVSVLFFIFVILKKRDLEQSDMRSEIKEAGVYFVFRKPKNILHLIQSFFGVASGSASIVIAKQGLRRNELLTTWCKFSKQTGKLERMNIRAIEFFRKNSTSKYLLLSVNIEEIEEKINKIVCLSQQKDWHIFKFNCVNVWNDLLTSLNLKRCYLPSRLARQLTRYRQK